jgi:1-acyl-sn-glycerol-3-phosphate acyltransferase
VSPTPAAPLAVHPHRFGALASLGFAARVAFTAAAFLGFWLGGAVLALTVLPLVSLRHARSSRTTRAAACQRWVQVTFTWLHDFMRVFTLLDFNPRRVTVARPDSGFVVMANHPTLVDVVALASVFGRLSCVAKASLFRSPILGQILKACDYVNGGDGDPFAGAMVVSQGVERVKEGMPLLIFPEGTRSPTEGLGSFKKGACEIACRAGVPVLPMLLRCMPSALERGRPWYDIPRRKAIFTMTALPLVHPKDFGDDAAAMTRHCEDLFRRELGLGERDEKASTPASMSS